SMLPQNIATPIERGGTAVANIGRAKRANRVISSIEPLESRVLLSAVVVNTTVDSIYPPFTGIVSLRNAIQTANSSSSPTTITFDPKVFSSPQKIVLIQGTLTLNNAAGASTTVIGPPAGVTIDGDAQGDVLDLRQGAVTLSGIMVTNAKGAGIAV